MEEATDLAERFEDYAWPATVLLSPEAEIVLPLRGFRAPGVFAGLLEDVRAGREVSDEEPNEPRPIEDLTQVRLEARANLDRLKVWIASEPELSWVPPRAGLIGLGRLPDGLDSDGFARRLLAEPYRTFLLPGSAYDEPAHIRLGVGGGASVNLEKGLSRVSQALRDWRASAGRSLQ